MRRLYLFLLSAVDVTFIRILVCLFDARSDFKMVKYTCINIKRTVVLNGQVLHISDEFRACRNCYLHCFGKSEFGRLNNQLNVLYHLRNRG